MSRRFRKPLDAAAPAGETTSSMFGKSVIADGKVDGGNTIEWNAKKVS